MAWFPWVAMPKRSNMTPLELIDWLRYRAIDLGAPPAFLDCVEDLYALSNHEQEIDELNEKLEALAVFKERWSEVKALHAKARL